MLKQLNSSTLSEFVDVKTTAMIFRILVALFMFFGHGLDKLINVFGGNFGIVGDPIGIGVIASGILATFAEGICSLLIIAGFWTRFAALILTINMAIAVFFYHFPAGDWFAGLELPLLYLVSFIVIFLLGPGDHSIDNN